MAYANVQSSGLLHTTSGGGLSWTPGSTPTVNNLLTARVWSDQNTAQGATDVRDSSGTPINYTRDREDHGATSGLSSAIYSLLVPGGLTTPLRDVNTTTFVGGCFDEWSGNATSSVLDVTAGQATSVNATSGNTTAISTGANAGLALATLCLGGSSATEAITVTGTSFSHAAGSGAVDNNNTTDAAGEASARTASVASASITESWTWTDSTVYAASIASYNVPAGGGGGGLPFFMQQELLTGGMQESSRW